MLLLTTFRTTMPVSVHKANSMKPRRFTWGAFEEAFYGY